MIGEEGKKFPKKFFPSSPNPIILFQTFWKGLEKRGGVPSSPFRLRRDKLRRGKGPSLKRAFSPPQGTTFIGNRALKKQKGAVAKPAYRKRILIESFEQSERSLQRLRRWFGN